MTARFSVVVPTCRPHHALRATIESCLAQRHPSFEVVVFDNGGAAQVEALVAQLDDPRVRFTRSDRPLGINDSWEEALALARGEYVTLLGDDDGLMPDALTRAAGFFDRSELGALRWNKLVYFWPDTIRRPLANRLYYRPEWPSGTLEGLSVIRRVASFATYYERLPMIYNSFIHRDLLAEARRRGGRVFRSLAPDVYSGFVFAALAGTYGSSAYPLSIAGKSSWSLGDHILHAGGDNAVGRDHEARNRRDGVAFHASIPPRHSFETVIGDAFVAAAESYADVFEGIVLNRRRLEGSRNPLRSWWKRVAPHVLRYAGIPMSAFGVRNVHDAALVTHRWLGGSVLA